MERLAFFWEEFQTYQLFKTEKEIRKFFGGLRTAARNILEVRRCERSIGGTMELWSGGAAEGATLRLCRFGARIGAHFAARDAETNRLAGVLPPEIQQERLTQGLDKSNGAAKTLGAAHTSPLAAFQVLSVRRSSFKSATRKNFPSQLANRFPSLIHSSSMGSIPASHF
ncbi:unnamed protein product [Caenorhabditis auriculariae]|uniref:Uncharacterized protein n=1 Tax=Caenorhabditis auriculariae TaxID=2777116 RepID=A0A8S1HAB7_9PELO|nr:unnamed protein product [Caenorhabditis auriculariae]